MKINGLNVDEQKIADGLYVIICDKNEEAIVAFGMLPKWIMDMLEKMLREKVVALASPVKLTEQEIKDTIRPIIHAVTCGIYASAAKAGKMCV